MDLTMTYLKHKGCGYFVEYDDTWVWDPRDLDELTEKDAAMIRKERANAVQT